MKRCSKWLVAAAIAAFASGCATAPLPGDKPDPVPPRLHAGENNVKEWDRTGAFGPVPVEKRELGDKICRGIGAKKAIGYHPQAQDDNGNQIPGGGYYCSM